MTECEINSNLFATYMEWVNPYGKKWPWIANGGIFKQVVHSRGGNGDKLDYIRIGGNAYIEQLHPGSHDGNNHTSTLAPINVCGGEIKECYLTGRKNGAATIGSAQFWCNGGYMHEFLGAYMEPVNGDVTIKVDHALIDNFYGGGANPNQPVTGNINITVNNSYVDFFCGGPKVGDMKVGTHVNINAKSTTFGQFYGAGYGGTALTRVRTSEESPTFSQDYVFPINFDNYTTRRLKKNGGVNEFGTGYAFEYFPYSGGAGGLGVARFYVDYASLSLATVRQVNVSLNDCDLLQDYYGGGCQGRVDGDVTSILTNCRVAGNVFAGGYTAQATPCLVYPETKPQYSTYIKALAVYTPFGEVKPDTCYWTQVENFPLEGSQETYANIAEKEIYTTVDMSKMGEVHGMAAVTIAGNTHVRNSVYGGGNESPIANGQTKVIIHGEGVVVEKSIFGGGNQALVQGDTYVQVKNGTIRGNVYGAGNMADVVGKTRVVIGERDAKLDVEQDSKDEIELGAPERDHDR
jgi:hypothetical protein